MQFSLYRRRDAQLLAVPSVFVPRAFIEHTPAPELVAKVRIPPDQVSRELLVSIGLHGYAELHGSELALFQAAISEQGSTLPLA